MTSSLPAPFGKYELLEAIGSGGMADVYLARSVGVAGFERRLVLKCIKPEHARDPRFVAWFIHEAKIGVSLAHPNIVAVHELGKVGDTWYIAMEHLHGRDLNKVTRSLRAQGRRMPVALAVRVVAEVLRGLAFAHGAPGLAEGVTLVHRDVSPHNILLTFAGEVKLVDFGIARLLAGGAAGEAAEAGDDDLPVGGGKFAYMSPEQVSGRPVDSRSDLFSAGVVLWELVTGRRLFQHDDPDEKLRRVREAVVPHPEELGVEVDPALWAVLRRALARDPADRHESAAAFEDDLRSWLYDLPRRPGRTALGQLLHELFPEAAAHPAAADLQRLAASLERLDPPDEGSSASGSAPTPPPTGSVVRAADDERKRVAALVIDVDGFTELSLTAEPEALFKRHLQLLRWLRRVVVDEHGGTIQHVHDDRITVLFGATRTRHDDAERAVSCALALHRGVGELHDPGVAVRLAVGVHVGDVTVGRAGGRTRYMARGDTTRLARRLSERADHGEVLVSAAVARAVEGRFVVQGRPRLESRGDRGGVEVFAAVGPRTDPAPARGPWLRRGDEMERIGQALARLGERTGASLVLRGDLGSGKSRLVQELLQLARRGRTSVHVARVPAFGPPLGAVRDLVLAVLGHPPGAVDVGEPGPRLRQLGLAARDVENLEGVLGVRPARPDSDDAWASLRRLLAARAADEAVVVVLDDVHHLPDRDLPRLAALVDRLAERTVFVLLTLTGVVPAPLRHLDAVTLGPLAPAAIARLAASQLDVRHVGSSLVEHLVASCEGNPLYVRELVAALQDRGFVRVDGDRAELVGDPGGSLPGTLAGIVASRIDALDPAAKGALQIAAVLGESFPLSLLGEVVGVDDPVPLAEELAAHGLVQRGDGPDGWRFASGLVRRAALHGILGVQRRDHHRLVAAALERRAAQGGLDQPEDLARHCAEAGRLLDGARYAWAWARRAEEAGALEHARAGYREAIGWLERPDALAEPVDERTPLEALLRIRLGVVSARLGEPRQAERSLLLALEIAADGALPGHEMRAHLELGRLHVELGRAARATAHLQTATRLARMQHDPLAELDAARTLARLAPDAGKADEAARRLEDLAERTTDDRVRAEALRSVAALRARTGALDLAQRALDAALAAAARAGDRALEGALLADVGLARMWSDDAENAVATLRRAVQLAEEAGAERLAGDDHRWLGDAHLLKGDVSRAAASFRRGREAAEEAGWASGVRVLDAHLAFLDALRGDPGAADRLLALDDGSPETGATVRWLAGRLATLQGREDEARVTLDAATKLADRAGLAALATAAARARAALDPPRDVTGPPRVAAPGDGV